MHALKLTLTAVAVTAIAFGQAQPQTKTGQADRTAPGGAANLSAAESRFVQEALQSGRQEVETAQLALTQGSSAEVKRFAQRLVNDHSAVNANLERISGQTRDGGLGDTRSQTQTPQTTTPPVTSKEGKERTSTNTTGVDAKTGTPTATADHLSNLKGAEFDKAWVKHMVEAHEMGISKFEAAQRDAMNADLKNLITSTLPTLREHLTQARMLDTK